MKKYLLVAINSQYVHTNLAVRYLKKYVEKHSEKKVEIYETNINNQIMQIIKDIYELSPSVVVFSTYIWNKEYTFKIIQELRKILPDTKIGVGGPEATYIGDDYLFDGEKIDFLIRGEGERAFLNLINEDIKEIKGVYEEKMPALLDEIPFPYEKDEIDMAGKILYYESSRGCPFMCSYCLSSIDRGVRYFSLDRVKDDLKIFLDSNIKLLKFVDRTFNINKERYMGIWKYLVENYKEGITFHFEINANILDDETLAFLETVPHEYFQFEIGVQSINPKTMESIKRVNLLDRLSDNVKRINRNIHLHLDLIAGLPHETYEIFKNSFNYVYNLKPDMVQLGFLKLLKGTVMYEEADMYQYKYTNFTPYEVLSNKFISYKELSQLKEIEKILNFYYNSERFQNSLEYIIGENYSSPFEFYQELTLFFKERKLLDIGHKDIALYRYFVEFIVDKKIDTPIFYQHLKFDYLRNGKPGSYPNWFEVEKDSDLYDFVIKKKSFKTTREGHKNSELEIFNYNVIENRDEKIVMFFDYRDGSFEIIPKEWLDEKEKNDRELEK